MFKGFREFISRGSVVDLAVGVVIGAAFTSVVKGFTDSFLTPCQPDWRRERQRRDKLNSTQSIAWGSFTGGDQSSRPPWCTSWSSPMNKLAQMRKGDRGAAGAKRGNHSAAEIRDALVSQRRAAGWTATRRSGNGQRDKDGCRPAPPGIPAHPR
jgi:hypothetical protein